MTNLTNQFASVLISFDFPFVEIVIKSTLALALAALACQLLRRHSAALRHRVWVIGLAAALLVPLASLLLPRIFVPVLPTGAPTLAAPPELQPIIPVDDADTSLPDTMHGSSARSGAQNLVADTDLPGVVATTADAQPLTHQSGVVTRRRIEPLLIFVWLLVSALSCTFFVVLLVVQRMRLGGCGKSMTLTGSQR